MQKHTLDNLRIPSAVLSAHAAIRLRQRSIPQAIVDLLIDFGEASSAGSGASRHSFSKRSWRAAAAYLGPAAKHYERYRSAYVVMAGTSVITAAWAH